MLAEALKLTQDIHISYEVFGVSSKHFFKIDILFILEDTFKPAFLFDIPPYFVWPYDLRTVDTIIIYFVSLEHLHKLSTVSLRSTTTP